jgi:hypothetical protein
MMRGALSLGLSTFLTLALAFPVTAAPRAGVAAAVRGKVTLDRTGSVGLAVQTGAQIYLGDRIATGAEGGLQVMLLDESVFTLGPNSALVVDRFVYDPKSGSGELDTELVRGAFRFVSGKIAKRDPSKMNVKLPAGTIGVRGTIVGAQVDPATGRSLVWLAGPGAGNSAGVPAGSIAVENAGVAQDVQRSGWGVEIPDFSSPPSPPFQVPDTIYGTLGFEVAPEGGGVTDQDDADGTTPEPAPAPPSPTAEAGSLEPLALLPPGDLPTTTEIAAIIPEPLGPISNPIPPGDVISFTPTTVMDLTSLAATFSGHFFFNLADVPLSSGSGNLDLIVDLDFTEGVVGVQVLQIASTQLMTQGTGAGATSLSFTEGIGGDAKFVAQFNYFESISSFCINGCPVQVDLKFLNIPTQVAGQLETTVTVGPVGTIVETTPPQSVPITVIAPDGSLTSP